MAEQSVVSSSEYIKHHLTNMTYGHHPELGWKLAETAEEAKAMGYKRLYLETTPQMEKAQKLFIRFGFRPVTQAQQELKDQSSSVPSYFILENLADAHG